ncbi:MAG: leucine-rich repeat protein [Clostridia bacterium]|nr:leucine-rich repeat protein [Clostridia bacterium]
MKKVFRITALILMSLLVILSLASCGSASPDSDSGSCGSGLTWSYDSDTKVLSISGNGSMTDFESSSEAPWVNAKSAIKTITVSDGVQTVGNYAFYGFTALESVNLPESLASIGSSAFAFSTALTNVSLPSSLQTIGDGAFEGCSALTAAFVPASVVSIGEKTFAYCYSITDAAILTAINVPDGAFLNCRSLDKLLLNTAISSDMIAQNAFEGCKVSYADASFTESSTASASVTVKYVDTDGNELCDSIVKENIEYGDSYSVVSPAVEGYTADKLTVNGYVYGENVTVTVTYTANAVEETEPVEDTAEEDEEVNVGTIIAVVIFAVLLIGIAIAAVLLIRSDKKNAQKGTTVRKKPSNDKKRK